MVFISNYHPSIKKYTAIVFSNSIYRVCTYRLKQNLSAHFKDIDVGSIFKVASKAYQLTHFSYYINEIYKLSEAVEKYLEKVRIDK